METRSPSEHQPRLMRAIGALLRGQRVAALATLEADGSPFVSMVPFATEPEQACLVLHVSALAQHTGNMARDPRISLLVMQAEQADQPVHALPRLSLLGRAGTPEPGGASWAACRVAYLARFPEAEPMTRLGDFRFVAIELSGARQIAGFGAARSVDADELRRILALSAERPPRSAHRDSA
ncbi:MAG: pyridoxamine 5'-phosphate oxidase family protein [Malikia sp.]|nr:pyridoxamine 5'-phosphate oxidase family protein [Malikia sp.]